ncbi:MAG: glycosyltransferase family 9 protein [Planctomycetota bacterium]
MKIADRYLGIPLLYLIKLLLGLFQRPSGNEIEIRKILMIKLWGIGNLVMIIPLIRAVKKQYPQADLYFLTLRGNEPLLRPVPSVNHLISFHPGGLFSTCFRLMKIVRTLKRHEFDLILDFEQFVKTTPIIAALSGAKQTIGFKTEGQARSTLYNVKVPYRRDRHMSLAYGDIVRSAGISTDGIPPLEVPRLEHYAKEAEAFLASLPQGQGPLVVLHVGSGDNFPGRRWPAESFGHLARRLVESLDARCVITGTLPETPLAARCEMAAGVPITSAIGCFGILTFIEFLARVDLLVTNDTAPAHIGSALGIPLIAFYGPNTPDLYGPLHLRSRAFYSPLPCSPCLTNLNAKTSRCRIPSCILGITVDEVYVSAEALLSNKGPLRDMKAKGFGYHAKENLS